MKINFLILVMILSACQNMENRNENSFFKNEKENIFGTQFHPEKSDKLGLKIIDNFINI